ncbi:MAG: hypothetical protein ACFB14_08530 [Leptolyngbyaceae cyanobacterium]
MTTLRSHLNLEDMYISYYLDIPSGPAITLTLFSCFVLALLCSPSKSILTDSLFFDKRQNTPEVSAPGTAEWFSSLWSVGIKYAGRSTK